MRKEARMRRLLRELKAHYRKNARAHLPWRPPTLKLRKGKADPYKILVSEVMLQQTQVERVVPFYAEFTRRFPTAHSLSRAPLREVLRAWQGLGYNRRAKYLRLAARVIAEHGFPASTAELERLPGVGRYTARAVAAFAYDRPEVFVETNIRTVFLHHFYSSVLQKTSIRKISDTELLPLVAEALRSSRMEPRQFYAALMDYGAHLKKGGVKLNTRSVHYAKQSKFEGSARQVRGSIVRELLKHRTTLSVLAHKIPRNREALAHELSRLAAEGIVSMRGRYFAIRGE